MFRPRNAAIFKELHYLSKRCVRWPKRVAVSRLRIVQLVGNKFVYIMTKLTESSEKILRIQRHLKIRTVWSWALWMLGVCFYRVTPQSSFSRWNKTFWPIERRRGELAPSLYRMHINVVSLSPNYTIALQHNFWEQVHYEISCVHWSQDGRVRGAEHLLSRLWGSYDGDYERQFCY